MNQQENSRSQVGAAEVAPVTETLPAKCCCSRPGSPDDQAQAENAAPTGHSMEVSS